MTYRCPGIVFPIKYYMQLIVKLIDGLGYNLLFYGVRSIWYNYIDVITLTLSKNVGVFLIIFLFIQSLNELKVIN